MMAAGLPGVAVSARETGAARASSRAQDEAQGSDPFERFLTDAAKPQEGKAAPAKPSPKVKAEGEGASVSGDAPETDGEGGAAEAAPTVAEQLREMGEQAQAAYEAAGRDTERAAVMEDFRGRVAELIDASAPQLGPDVTGQLRAVMAVAMAAGQGPVAAEAAVPAQVGPAQAVPVQASGAPAGAGPMTMDPAAPGPGAAMQALLGVLQGSPGAGAAAGMSRPVAVPGSGGAKGLHAAVPLAAAPAAAPGKVTGSVAGTVAVPGKPVMTQALDGPAQPAEGEGKTGVPQAPLAVRPEGTGDLSGQGAADPRLAAAGPQAGKPQGGIEGIAGADTGAAASGPVKIETAAPLRDLPPGLAPLAEAGFGEAADPARADAAALRSARPGAEMTPPGFARHVTAQIRNASFSEGRTRFELTPEGLGGIEIEMGPDEAGRLRIVVRAENHVVLNALRNDREGLLESLRSGGVAVNEGELSFEDFGQGRSGAQPWRETFGGGEDVAPLVERAPQPLPRSALRGPDAPGLDIVA